MKRSILPAGWLLPLACLTAISCSEAPTAPASSSGAAPASLRASANAATGTAAAGTAAGARVPAQASPVAGAAGRDASACTEAAPADGGWEEPAPTELCSIAQFLPGTATPPGRPVVAAFIDETGGSLRLGDFELVVPAGAVDRATRFAIMLPPPGAGARVYAEFLPHGRAFAVPVTIRLPLAATSAASDAPVSWWSQPLQQWIDQPSVTTADGRVEAQVGHFSFYATRLRSGITIAGG